MSGPVSPTVSRVLRGRLCAGCGLCASLSDGAIAMGTTRPGYSRPVQTGPLEAAAEAAIAASCPGAVVAPWPPGARTHPYWGPWRTIATGHAMDAATRFRGASGGALTALAVHALRSGLVDRVIHVVADPDHPTRNLTVCSTSARELLEGAGSRYAPSSPLAGIEDQLERGGALAFIGKPCDVSALRRLAAVDPRVAAHVPLMLSFFCAGVSSHAAADRVVAALGVETGELAAFRYRGHGWPGAATAVARDGRETAMSYEESWGGHLSHEVQFRCKICPDAVGGVADIACGDAWYGDARGYPSFEEGDGRSLIIARTAAGTRLLESAMAAGALSATDLDVGEIERMQPGQARRKRLVAARTAALTATLQPAPDMRGTGVREAARRAGWGERARAFLGSARRIVRNAR